MVSIPKNAGTLGPLHVRGISEICGPSGGAVPQPTPPTVAAQPTPTVVAVQPTPGVVAAIQLTSIRGWLNPWGGILDKRPASKAQVAQAGEGAVVKEAQGMTVKRALGQVWDPERSFSLGGYLTFTGTHCCTHCQPQSGVQRPRFGGRKICHPKLHLLCPTQLRVLSCAAGGDGLGTSRMTTD